MTYLWIAICLLLWLAGGLWVTDIFGRTVDEMEHEENDDMPPIERTWE